MKILVISAAGIGDTLIATPFLHELRLNFPDAVIDVFVLWAGSKDLLEGNPFINTIHQKNLISEGAGKAFAYVRRLRSLGYDLTINVHTQGRIHYRIVARMIGAPIRVSHQYENYGWWDSCLVNRTIPQDYTVHSVENNRRLLPLLGKERLLRLPELEVYLSHEDEAWAAAFIDQHQLSARRILGLHVGSGGTKNLALKRWPLVHYLTMLDRFAQLRSDVPILLFGGPEERQAHAEILGRIKKLNLIEVRSPNLRQAAALLKRCHAFLSVDTALMHLAAAMKVPRQIVIEAPTLNPTNLPWNTSFQVVRNPVVDGRNLEYYRYDGRPIRGSPEELLACMASVSVDEVLQAVTTALLPE